MTYYVTKNQYLDLVRQLVESMIGEETHEWHPEDIAIQVEVANEAVKTVLEKLPAKEVTD